MLSLQLDLFKFSHPVVLNIIAPVFPGGVVALGWLYGHGAVWGTLHDERILKIVVGSFAVYVTGVVVSYLSEFELVFAALVAVLLMGSRPRDHSTNSEWRQVASKFLGAELSPPLEKELSWEQWYEVLGQYFPVTNFDNLFGSFYFLTITSIGWAGLVAGYISGQHCGWMIWASCVLLIVTNHVVFPLQFAKQRADSQCAFTAEILKAIKNHP